MEPAIGEILVLTIGIALGPVPFIVIGGKRVWVTQPPAHTEETSWR